MAKETKPHATKKASERRDHSMAILALCIAALAFGSSAWQAWTATDAEKRGLRAYAFPVPGPVKNFRKYETLTVSVGTRSMGQTPAYHVRAMLNVRPMDYPLSDTVDLNLARTVTTQNSAFIGPTNSFDIKGSFGPIDETILNAINDGNKYRLYVWGRVDYEDVFAKPHWFTFCYNFSGATIVDPSTIEVCNRHNDDDHG